MDASHATADIRVPCRSKAACAPDLSASEPVVFGSFTGIFQPAQASSSPPVLMFSAFGFEELCSRAFWTVLADRLAAAGIPSLRFDYPGTANALDAEVEGLDDWQAAAQAAAAWLRLRTSSDEIVLLGQSLGATLALHWASRLGPLAAAVLLGPPATGRTYLRGLKAWGAAVAAGSGMALTPEEIAGHSVAGFPVPAGRIAAMRALDLGGVPETPGAVLLLEQPGGAVGKLLTARVGKSGAVITRESFAESADLLTDPTSAKFPMAAADTIIAWLVAQTETRVGKPAHSHEGERQTMGSVALKGDGFSEQPIRFGPGARLAGVLCLPERPDAAGSAFVIANAGRDYSIGWGRSSVAQARALALRGVASLRFDVSGIGDSRAAENAPAEVLYSSQMCSDLAAAIDHLDRGGHRSIGLLGRCSGAWAAFTVAANDPRVRSLALVNTAYFFWDPATNLEDVIRFAQRRAADVGGTLLRRDGWRRLLTARLDWRGASRFLLRHAARQVMRRNAACLGRLTPESRRYHDFHAAFARLRNRNVRVLLAYAVGDASLVELRSFVGARMTKLALYPNVSVCEVAGADHNFTPRAAREGLLAHLLEFAGANQPFQHVSGVEKPSFRAILPYGTLPQNV